MIIPTNCLKSVFAIVVVVTISFGGHGHAKPLLTNSESTYASACIDQQDTPERLIEICQLGLGEVGASDGQRIEMLDKMAWAHFDLDNFDQAEEAFGEILSLDPNAEPGLQGQGWVAYYRDDHVLAAVSFRKAASRKPNAYNMAGLAASQRRNGQIGFDEFEQNMRVALALDPEYTWALRELAWGLNDQGRNDGALELFKSAIEVDPSDAYAEYGMAFVLSELGEWDAAFEHVTRALDLKPDFIAAKSRRSLILLVLERPKQALKDSEVVIEAWPEDAEGYVRKARALSALGQRSDAHAVLANAEEQIGTSSYLLYWRAKLLVDDSEFDAALVQIRRSVELEDADHFDHRLHAEIAHWLGKPKEAREAINRTLFLDADGSYARFIHALVLLSEGNFAASESTFDDAVSLGLSEDYLSDYLSELVAEGRIMQAIKMRVRYSNR
ncbi:tetratricopeptide repeat protein [uncultured Ruegeria sp.]|uniref:tetratricopeptide repeat protein n=1 Tax=uncultured Ruegeria sp. TaxID=259304 RepID=UPI00261903F7|nr:tetratricopeptide repeat protein [uncultured Ruegeria sp.]